ncbi:Fc.00g028350.m01.CDS01 [Cosmosporella sp. VM-42]
MVPTHQQRITSYCSTCRAFWTAQPHSSFPGHMVFPKRDIPNISLGEGGVEKQPVVFFPDEAEDSHRYIQNTGPLSGPPVFEVIAGEAQASRARKEESSRKAFDKWFPVLRSDPYPPEKGQSMEREVLSVCEEKGPIYSPPVFKVPADSQPPVQTKYETPGDVPPAPRHEAAIPRSKFNVRVVTSSILELELIARQGLYFHNKGKDDEIEKEGSMVSLASMYCLIRSPRQNLSPCAYEDRRICHEILDIERCNDIMSAFLILLSNL